MKDNVDNVDDLCNDTRKKDDEKLNERINRLGCSRPRGLRKAQKRGQKSETCVRIRTNFSSLSF